MAIDTSGSESLYWKTGLDTTQLVKDSNNIVGLMSGLTRTLAKIPIFGWVGIASGAAFAKASKDAYNFERDFRYAMAEVMTISDAVRRNLEGTLDAVTDISRSVPDSATQLTKAYYQVVSAGYDGAQGLEVLEQASRGAVAGITDTLTSVDGLTTILNAFHLEASQSEHVLDVLFRTVQKGKTTFPELANNIAIVAPLAAAMGVSLEEVSGAIATLTKQGNPTNVALTQIRRVLISMGEVLGDTWVETMTFQEALQKLRDMAGGSTTKLREMLGRVEAVNAVLGLTGENSSVAISDLEAMQHAYGATSEAFEIMVDEVQNQTKILANNIASKLRPIGKSIYSFTKDVLKGVNALFEGTLTDSERLERSVGALKNAIDSRRDILSQLVADYDKAERGTSEFEQAERSLAILLEGTTSNAYDTATSKLFLYADAKEELIALTERSLELETKLAKIEAKNIEIAYEKAKRGLDETGKALDEAQKKFDKITKKEGNIASGIVDRVRTDKYEDGDALGNMIQKLKNLGVETSKYSAILADLKNEELDEAQIEKLTLDLRDDLIKASGDYEDALTELALADMLHANTIEEKRVLLEAVLEKVKLLESGMSDLADTTKKSTDEEEKATKRSIKDSELKDKNMQSLVEKEKRRAETQKAQIAEANEYYNSKNKDWLQSRIETLETELTETEAHSHASMKIEEELAERRAQLSALHAENNEQSLKDILEDTRRMHKKELQAYIDKLNKQYELAKNNKELRIALSKEISDATRALFEREYEEMESLIKLFDSLAQHFDGLENKFAHVMQSASIYLDSYQGIIEGLGSGDYISAGTSALSGLTRAIDDLIGSQRRAEIADFQAEIGKLFSFSIPQQERWVERGSPHYEWIERAKQHLDNLQNALHAKWDELTEEQRLSLQNMIDQWTDTVNEELTGTTAESIAESIYDGFAQGLDSAEVFAQSFEELMKNALANAFKRNIQERYINDLYNEFAALYDNDNELTKDEIITLSTRLREAVKNSSEEWEKLNEVLEGAGVNLSDTFDKDSTLSGAIQGITEDTAGLLAGQFNAIRVDVRQIRSQLESGFSLGEVDSKLEKILSRVRNIDDSCYYIDDIYKRADHSLDALREIRDATYNLDDILRRIDDILLINTRIADNTEYLKSIDRRLSIRTSDAAFNEELDMSRATGV